MLAIFLSKTVKGWSARRAVQLCLAVCAAGGIGLGGKSALATLILSGVPTENVTPGQTITFEVDLSATTSDQGSFVGAFQVYLQTPYNAGSPLATFQSIGAPTAHTYIFPAGFAAGGSANLWDSSQDAPSTAPTPLNNAAQLSDFYNSTGTGVALGTSTAGLETLTLQIAANAPIGSQIPLTFIDSSQDQTATGFSDNNGNNPLTYVPANFASNIPGYNPASPAAAGTLTVVPEPSSLLLTLFAAVGFAWFGCRRLRTAVN